MPSSTCHQWTGFYGTTAVMQDNIFFFSGTLENPDIWHGSWHHICFSIATWQCACDEAWWGVGVAAGKPVPAVGTCAVKPLHQWQESPQPLQTGTLLLFQFTRYIKIDNMLLCHIFTNYVCMYVCMNSEMFTATSYYKLRITYPTVPWVQHFFRALVLAFLPYFYKISCPRVFSCAPMPVTPVTDFMKLCMSVVPLVSSRPFHFFPISTLPLWQPYCWDRHDACTILFSILKLDLVMELNKLW